MEKTCANCNQKLIGELVEGLEACRNSMGKFIEIWGDEPCGMDELKDSYFEFVSDRAKAKALIAKANNK